MTVGWGEPPRGARPAGRTERRSEMAVLSDAARREFESLTDKELREEWAFRRGWSTRMAVGDILDVHMAILGLLRKIARERGIDLEKGVR